jgi:hypothetical protein
MRLLIGAGTPKEAIARGKGLILLVPLPDGSILVMLAAIEPVAESAGAKR